MPNLISLRAARNFAALGGPEALSKFDALRSCQECGVEAVWGLVEERMAYCQRHALGVDHALAAEVDRVVEPLALATWLEQRPESWRAREETWGKEWTAENREELEEWLQGYRGDPVLVPYLEDAVGRSDLRVSPPVVNTLEWGPVTHLPAWTERFTDMLRWHAVGGEGADAHKVLEVLRKAVELDELAAQGPGAAIVAKVREAEVRPAEIREAMDKAIKAEQRRSRKGLLRRLFGGE